MSKHTVTAEIEVKFQLPSTASDECEVAYPKVKITFDYRKGCPACMYQPNGDPGWPAEPAELEFFDANLIAGDGLNPTQQQIDEWAKDWLDDAGYERACEAAAHDGPDPDDLRDRKRDDAYDNIIRDSLRSMTLLSGRTA